MFEKLFSIKGRMNRIDYFLYTMVLVIIYFLVKYNMVNSAGLYIEKGEIIPFIIFAFVVTHRGLQPAGLGLEADEAGDCENGKKGWMCTARIIRDGWTIKYLE